MKQLTYIVIGVLGTLAVQKMLEHQEELAKEMKKMMKHNSKTFRKIREIF
ncbi:MAG: hypothetical protein GX676_06455 [Bacilli bacterium]|nr:hypothetical protein [Bacilli bacterium]